MINSQNLTEKELQNGTALGITPVSSPLAYRCFDHDETHDLSIDGGIFHVTSLAWSSSDIFTDDILPENWVASRSKYTKCEDTD